MIKDKKTASRQEVNITRIFDAPREVVFKAWSDAEQLKRWYAPNGCTLSYCNIDFVKGGVLHTCIRIPDGTECWVKGFYREIVAPEKIVFTSAFADADGNFVEDSPVGKDPEWPTETIITVVFEEENGKTKMTLHQTASEEVAKRTGAYGSWLQMLDTLAEGL